tara:strand:- start:62 stop:472 length:411 start_codon:yes stop_codon:yes gene_type:complete
MRIVQPVKGNGLKYVKDFRMVVMIPSLNHSDKVHTLMEISGTGARPYILKMRDALEAWRIGGGHAPTRTQTRIYAIDVRMCTLLMPASGRSRRRRAATISIQKDAPLWRTPWLLKDLGVGGKPTIPPEAIGERRAA